MVLFSFAPRARGVALSYLKTAILMAVLLAVLMIGGQYFGGTQGMILFGALGLVVNFASYWFSDRITLLAHRARPLSRSEAPELFAIVGRLAERAGMPTPPIYLIPSHTPNAFATGRGPRHAAVAVTAGLLEALDPRQIEGVLAHELSHVKNRDVLIATVAAAIAGLIASLGYVLQWTLLFGQGGQQRRGSSFAALAWIVVAPIIALLVQLAISRTRELSADASGGKLSGKPGALADALETIERYATSRPYEYAGPATAHLFIINPLRGRAAVLANLLSTHPPTAERVRRLRASGAKRPEWIEAPPP